MDASDAPEGAKDAVAVKEQPAAVTEADAADPVATKEAAEVAADPAVADSHGEPTAEAE